MWYNYTMQRGERLNIIKEIVSNKKIATQEELQDLLVKQGVIVTQATLSRDIRKLNIIKKREEKGSFYSLLGTEKSEFQSQLELYFHNFALSANSSGPLVVIKSKLGEADVLANAFDEDRPDILGTIAGADTLLVICASDKDAKALTKEINHIILD